MWQYNARFIPLSNVIAACMIALVFPMVRRTNIFPSLSTAEFGEILAGLMGIILLPGLAFLESAVGLKETIGAKVISHRCAAAIRLGYSVILIAGLLSIFLCLAPVQSGQPAFGKMLVGLTATALMLGGMGLCCANMTRSMSISFMLPCIYFMMEYFTRGRYTKQWCIISLIHNQFQYVKFVYLVIGGLLLLFNIFLSLRQITNENIPCSIRENSFRHHNPSL